MFVVRVVGIEKLIDDEIQVRGVEKCPGRGGIKKQALF
jgi:hypothetical protein